MRKFIMTTAIGGVFFLVPLVVITLIIGKAFQLMLWLAGPINKLLPVDSIAGIGMVEILAVILMLLICLLAGMFARSQRARYFHHRTDSVVAELVPGYNWIKTVLKNLAGETETDRFKPVSVQFDDQLSLAFEMERTANGLVVVFLPGAPDVRSGSVVYVSSDRVTALDASFLNVNKVLKHMGQGAAALLK